MRKKEKSLGSSLGGPVFPLLDLLDQCKDVGTHILSHLTRRQALLASGACRSLRRLVVPMLERLESPFRKALVVACSLPGRLIDVDVSQPGGLVMWNTCHTRPRRRCSRRSTSEANPVWTTGLSVGPSAWEAHRRAAAEAGPAAEAGAAARTTSNGGAPAGTSPAAGRLRAAASGPTLYACRYDAPGVLALDGTTLLPLGLLVRFTDERMQQPEGICASPDALFVVDAENCMVARIGLEPLARRPGARGARGDGGGGDDDDGEDTCGWGSLPYGRGVVLAIIVAGEGRVGWGLTIDPYGTCLYCSADMPYGTGRRQYSRCPPPATTGTLLCVPLSCLGVGRSAEAAAAGGDGGGGSGAAVQAPPAATAHTLPYTFTRGPPVLRRPSGLRFAPDGRSIWVTSYDTGLVQVAGPAYGDAAGTVLRVAAAAAAAARNLPAQGAAETVAVDL
ncbi:hypothetical protein TSOC_005650 [Tetrabaena socialis]|uniref:F-box domain-containing protein n=1 Tax=Tetrabaena socialis TaxID=47790 RepID=A0A2J8A5V1_9CHLO|nr:hypothetical protein TSOC_005650 [Tetrabaena socialis]|eukprot:PNH07873.1 hypothetical protein TSOC_005650 [Tetrabaena socialis]